jgi:hypothetical protein
MDAIDDFRHVGTRRYEARSWDIVVEKKVKLGKLKKYDF